MVHNKGPQGLFVLQVFSVCIIVTLLVYIGLLSYAWDNTNSRVPAGHQENTVDPFHRIVAPSTRFIAPWALSKWSNSEYLIVFGIPSDDNPSRQRRRDLQREHCWSYDGVAALRNQYSGVMLALYVMGRSPLHQFKYSTALENEAKAWQDVLTLPIKEGRKSTNKHIGGSGLWGVEAEIGMSRKTFLWFYLSSQLFPKASYVAKGDDDIFIRVPAYLGTLRVLPRKGIYWGYLRRRVPGDFRAVARGSSTFLYAGGSCMTLAKDMVENFLSHKPLRHVALLPYNKSRMQEFNAVVMQNEDVMVGLVLHNSAYPNIVYVKEPECRMHDVHSGGLVRPVTTDSVVVHHVREPEYRRLRDIFQNETNNPNTPIYVNNFEIETRCSSDSKIISLEDDALSQNE